MARRVGFGAPRNEEDRRARRARREEAPPAPEAVPFEPASTRKPAPTKRVRLIGAGFLGLWLVIWTIGILFAVVALVSLWDEGDAEGVIFLSIWLALASLGWIFALRTLRKILRGEPVRMRGRGGARMLSNYDWTRSGDP